MLLLSPVWHFVTPWTAAHQGSLSFTISQSAQTLVHWIDDASQPFHLLSSPFPAFNLSHHQGLFQCVFELDGQSIGSSASASVLPMNIQGRFPLGLTGLISLLSKGLSSIFSSTTVRKHQFFGTQPSLWFNYHNCTWLLEKSQLWLDGPFSAKWRLCFLICSLGLS